MYDYIYHNKEFISDIIEQEVSYYYVYLLRKFVYWNKFRFWEDCLGYQESCCC